MITQIINNGKPYQLMFGVGAIQGILIILWWGYDIFARFTGLPLATASGIVSHWAHIYLMLFSFFPLFIFGFLMTAYPVWMGSDPIKLKSVLPGIFLLIIGIFLTNIGIFFNNKFFLVGAIFFAIGWLFSVLILINIFKNANKKKTAHSLLTIFFLIIGLIFLYINAYGISNNNVQIINLAKVGGVWWFLFPLFISICHRLIPFFTSVVIPQYEIYRPNKLLILMLILIFLHGLLELKHHISYLWFVDINIAIISCWLSWKWFNRQICNKRILFMLHIAYMWVPISFTLFALQSILSQNGFYLLSSGPLHCVTIGFFTSMLFAMITRVSLGHSSRQVHANPFLWKLFLFIQLATLLRLIGGFNINFHYGQILFVVSALIWLFCFSGWLKEFLNIYYDDLKG
mgnify:FL=1